MPASAGLDRSDGGNERTTTPSRGAALLIVNGDLPIFPGRIGCEYLHTTRLTRFAERVGLVSMVNNAEQEAKKRDLEDAGVALYLWRSPSIAGPPSAAPSAARRFVRWMRDLIRVRPWRPADTVLQDLHFRNMSRPLTDALTARSWDALIVIQSQCARWIDYLPRVPASVLVLHDVRALAWERKARAAASTLERIACSLEAWRYRRFERKYCRKYDLVLTVSRADEAWVREHYAPRRLATVPLPVDADYFRPLRGTAERASRIIFTGLMEHPPNVDAACFFAREVFPRVRATIAEAEFWIVGRDPTPEVLALASIPGVVVTGFVLDVRPYFAEATVVVVPIRYGSGMRNKILEAWAMEKCIVSTSVGAEGLDYRDGANIIIADDAGTMADRVVEAIRDPPRRREIRSKGRELVLEKHLPDTLARFYAEAVYAVVREKRAREEPLEIAIDLRWMHPGVAGGIENLSRSLLEEVGQLDRSNRYTVVVPTEGKYDLDVRSRPNFRMVASDGPRETFRRVAWVSVRVLHRLLRADFWRTGEVEVLRRAHRLAADVVLSTSGYIFTDMYPLRNVLVIPDLQHEFHPEFFTPEAVRDRRRIYGDSLRIARRLIAISEHTRGTVIDRIGIDPDRITTLHLAADPIFHPKAPARRGRDDVLQKHRLQPGEYLLFPANTWPHKNHKAALEALAILRERRRLTPTLVCTGAKKEAKPAIAEAIARLGLERQVRFIGYRPLDEMPALYEGAAALVFPSLYEGFGIPLVEAMWSGCPIVCSNTTSLPEIAGDAALLVDPRSPEDLASALERVLSDTSLRAQLVARGRVRAPQFSWSKFALGAIAILHEVASGSHG